MPARPIWVVDDEKHMRTALFEALTAKATPWTWPKTG
jgi:DNA-binding NtrC family response regulator